MSVLQGTRKDEDDEWIHLGSNRFISKGDYESMVEEGDVVVKSASRGRPKGQVH